MMHAGLHAIGWGLPRLAIALVFTVFAILIAYSMVVFAIIAVQGFNAMFP
jgi:hypothetical protein